MLGVGAEQVRILLFRECEWRGRKLLFDSITVQKHRSKSETVCTAVNNNAEGKCETPFNIGTARDFEVIIEFRIITYLHFRLRILDTVSEM